MKLTRVIAIAIIAASGGLGIAQAQSLRDAGQPAEFPPSSYTGRQYVDSAGCVYVRAGIDGNITWVPRVTRSRQTMCGQTPSLPGLAKADDTAPTIATATPAPAPQAQPKAEPQPVAAVPTPTPAPQRVIRKAAAPTPKPVPKRVVRAAPTPVTVAPVAVAKPATKPQPVRRTVRAVQTACPGASAVSARYLTTASGYAVRCGPQSVDHVTRVQGTMAARSAPVLAPAPSVAAPRPTAVPAYDPVAVSPTPRAAATRVVRVDPYTTRVAPRHVVLKQQVATRGVSIPEGYKRVWMDGRLNPHRAHQTFAGKAQMELMWTKTVPRRLIVTDTGRDVSHDHPNLVYPYTSYEQQRAAMAARKAPPAATISTRSRQPEDSKRYVQAGIYATRAQAETEARRLAGTGLPTRLGSMTRGGTRYSLVLSGPFASRQDAQGALQRVRSAGFGNARLR